MKKSIPHRFDNGKEEKLCNRCHKWKPLSDFQRCNARKDGYNSMCTECYRPYSLANFKKNYIHRTRKPHIDLVNNTRTCTKCGETKSLENFCRLKRGPGGYHSRCRECLKEDRRIYYNKTGVVSGRTKAIPHKVVDGVEYKYCGNCKQWLVLDTFSKSSTIKDGYVSQCKRCVCDRTKQYVEENLEQVLACRKECAKNRSLEQKEKHRRRSAMYYDALSSEEKLNRSRKYKASHLNKYPFARLNRSISERIRFSLRLNDLDKEYQHWEGIVGWTLEDLKERLQSLFSDSMSWDNYGRGKGRWNIDHIVPQTWFSFSSYEDEGFKQCWSLDNLQPKWTEDNCRKGNRYIG